MYIINDDLDKVTGGNSTGHENDKCLDIFYVKNPSDKNKECYTETNILDGQTLMFYAEYSYNWCAQHNYLCRAFETNGLTIAGLKR